MNQTTPPVPVNRTPSEIETLVKAAEDFAAKGRGFTHKLLSGLCQDFRRGDRQNDARMQANAVASLEAELAKPGAPELNLDQTRTLTPDQLLANDHARRNNQPLPYPVTAGQSTDPRYPNAPAPALAPARVS